MCVCLTVLLICIVILAWNYRSLDLLTKNKQSSQQGLEHFRAFFLLHRKIMPTTGESEEVNEEEIILELERENKRREDCSYQNAPHFRKTENEWRRFRVD